MRYYKVMRGFGQDDFIPITEDELERALYAHMSGEGVLLLDGGSIEARHISAVMPDIHRAKGWNYGYKLGPEDWAESGKALRDHQTLIAAAKSHIHALIAAGQADRIGKSTVAEIEAAPGVRLTASNPRA